MATGRSRDLNHYLAAKAAAAQQARPASGSSKPQQQSGPVSINLLGQPTKANPSTTTKPPPPATRINPVTHAPYRERVPGGSNAGSIYSSTNQPLSALAHNSATNTINNTNYLPPQPNHTTLYLSNHNHPDANLLLLPSMGPAKPLSPRKYPPPPGFVPLSVPERRHRDNISVPVLSTQQEVIQDVSPTAVQRKQINNTMGFANKRRISTPGKTKAEIGMPFKKRIATPGKDSFDPTLGMQAKRRVTGPTSEDTRDFNLAPNINLKRRIASPHDEKAKTQSVRIVQTEVRQSLTQIPQGGSARFFQAPFGTNADYGNQAPNTVYGVVSPKHRPLARQNEHNMHATKESAENDYRRIARPTDMATHKTTLVMHTDPRVGGERVDPGPQSHNYRRMHPDKHVLHSLDPSNRPEEGSMGNEWNRKRRVQEPGGDSTDDALHSTLRFNPEARERRGEYEEWVGHSVRMFPDKSQSTVLDSEAQNDFDHTEKIHNAPGPSPPKLYPEGHSRANFTHPHQKM
eukprot:gnl/Hemi2/17752_TR5853_c0_g1_i1.p1 gnl/Hemi2/17752_TR5853_c0_g1~~gnl/Hemi2/17752_TR5853_c0_g1_i1.p1  ORF type:complete len:548 (+),score=164.05 gnl/Hemi2/17752_TR5853_c0_g1_i1:99-1646(+)